MRRLPYVVPLTETMVAEINHSVAIYSINEDNNADAKQGDFYDDEEDEENLSDLWDNTYFN